MGEPVFGLDKSRYVAESRVFVRTIGLLYKSLVREEVVPSALCPVIVPYVNGRKHIRPHTPPAVVSPKQ